ncbi:hypothetical protein COB11_03030 [Candidatus Aerophobetes bacterium]|uniref:Uncharacterized protein n=1 Tax=Aerophobetes bacterium TaxID=2030807 RepID=A0A2A4YJW4_UNCAE|nr:MAG: hypothetical protein COB11_03030 [Candidatus Aerophobetes bacterium]
MRALRLHTRLQKSSFLSKVLLTLLFATSISSLHAKYPREILIDSPSYVGGGGLFHNFCIVLGYLDIYERYPNISITIDMRDQGLYYEPSNGPNWWSYYFEPLHYPNRLNSVKRPILKRIGNHEKGSIGNAAHYYFSRKYAKSLIDKYIRVKQDILDEIDTFYDKHLKDKVVIGIHYRGTDKHLEASHLDYDMLTKALTKELRALGDVDYVIFLATDEPSVVERLSASYPDRLVYTDAERMQEPVHYASNKCYQKGREALVDMLLLAKSNIIIRTNSNLGAVSCFYNPKMKIVNLNYMNDRLYNGAKKNGKLNELNKKP